MAETDLYDSHYAGIDTDVHRTVRARTYGEDLGQTSWITAAEARGYLTQLGLGPGDRVLEVACGAGGITRLIARETGAQVLGIDVNGHAIDAARAHAERDGLADAVGFEVVDAGTRLPHADAAFDAVFCNDAINHLPGRAAVLAEWRRVLAPGGRLLFTDPIVVAGQLTSEEIAIRSSIGFFLFTPIGENERLLRAAGFELVESRDTTDSVAAVSKRWLEARAELETPLVEQEGRRAFEHMQEFLRVVHRLARERRLNRVTYLARLAPLARVP